MVLIRYTLRASRRGDARRGDSIVTPEGSDQDLALKGDAAWSRTKVPGSSGRNIPATRQSVQQAYAIALQFLREQAARVRALPYEDRVALAQMIAGNERTLAPLFNQAFPPPPRPEQDADLHADDAAGGRGAAGAPPPASSDQGADDSADNTREGEGGEPASAGAPLPALDPAAVTGLLDLLVGVILGDNDETSPDTMIARARSAGLALPDDLPDDRIELAQLLHELATHTEDGAEAPDPHDLGG